MPILVTCVPAVLAERLPRLVEITITAGRAQSATIGEGRLELEKIDEAENRLKDFKIKNMHLMVGGKDYVSQVGEVAAGRACASRCTDGCGSIIICG